MSEQTIDELSEVAQALSGALQIASRENDLLRRQVERLGQAAASLADSLSSCYDCPCANDCSQGGGVDCKESIIKWSLEQANGGGGE